MLTQLSNTDHVLLPFIQQYNTQFPPKNPCVWGEMLAVVAHLHATFKERGPTRYSIGFYQTATYISELDNLSQVHIFLEEDVKVPPIRVYFPH